jgi:hypothetical protein
MLLSAAALYLCAGGCASEVVPSTPHDPTSPAQVHIYQNAPDKKYEELGTIAVPVVGDVRWDDKGDADAGFDQLRQQAAARGANGILLDSDTIQAKDSVLAGDHGHYYTVPLRTSPNRAAVAEAIYVHE